MSHIPKSVRVHELMSTIRYTSVAGALLNLLNDHGVNEMDDRVEFEEGVARVEDPREQSAWWIDVVRVPDGWLVIRQGEDSSELPYESSGEDLNAVALEWFGRFEFGDRHPFSERTVCIHDDGIGHREECYDTDVDNYSSLELSLPGFEGTLAEYVDRH